MKLIQGDMQDGSLQDVLVCTVALAYRDACAGIEEARGYILHGSWAELLDVSDETVRRIQEPFRRKVST
jgi:hypothetical protein